MAPLPRPDFPDSFDFLVCGLAFCPGGGGGADPVDQLFPPVL